MDYNKFEDRISDWIENSMDIKERKEFEKYLAENPEHKKKVDDVRNAMNVMQTAPSLKTSDSFDKKLQDRINALNDKNMNKPTIKYELELIFNEIFDLLLKARLSILEIFSKSLNFFF